MKATERFLVILVILSMALMSCAILPENNKVTNRGDRYLYRIYDPNTGKFGYIDNQGNIVVKPQFDYGQEFFDDLGWVIDVEDEKYHYINRSGKIVFHTTYDDEAYDWGAGEFHEGMALIEIDEGLTGINRKGETVFFLPNWCSLEGKFSEGLALVHNLDLDKWGFINMTGEMVIGPISDKEVDIYGDFHEGLAVVWKNKAYGYMDKNGQMRIKSRFSYASDYSNGTAVVGLEDEKEKEEYFIINKNGETLKKLEQRWDKEWHFSEDMCAVKICNKYGLERYGFIDKEFKLIIEPKFDWYSESGFKGGIACVEDRDSGLEGYINKKGEWIYNWGIGRKLNFIFRDTTNQELIQTIESYGVIPLKGRYMFLSPADPVRMSDEASRAWVYKEGEKRLLLIGLESNMSYVEVGLLLEDVSKWSKFEVGLWGDTCVPRGMLCTSATLYVEVSYGDSAEQALREFALHVLKVHPGGVCDYDHDHAWTIEEIRSNAVIKGVTFIRQLEKSKK